MQILDPSLTSPGAHRRTEGSQKQIPQAIAWSKGDFKGSKQSNYGNFTVLTDMEVISGQPIPCPVHPLLSRHHSPSVLLRLCAGPGGQLQPHLSCTANMPSHPSPPPLESAFLEDGCTLGGQSRHGCLFAQRLY